MRELQSTRVFVTLSGWMHVAAALRRAEWSFQRATQSKANNATAEQRHMNIVMQPLCCTAVNQLPEGHELSEYFSRIFNITEILMRELKQENPSLDLLYNQV